MLQSIEKESVAPSTAKSISAYTNTANTVIYTVPDKRMFTGVVGFVNYSSNNYNVRVNGVVWYSNLERDHSPLGKVITLGPGTVIDSGQYGSGYAIGIERDLV